MCCVWWFVLAPVGVGRYSQLSQFRYFPIFHNNQNNGYLYDITFISDRCHRTWAAETPDKYKRDRKYLTYTFAKSKFHVNEKLTNEALVTPTPVGIGKGVVSKIKHTKHISHHKLYIPPQMYSACGRDPKANLKHCMAVTNSRNFGLANLY